jgi:hypothetical protein
MTVTTESDEVKIAGLLKSLETARHFPTLFLRTSIYRDRNHIVMSVLFGPTPTLSAKNADKGGAPNSNLVRGAGVPSMLRCR